MTTTEKIENLSRAVAQGAREIARQAESIRQASESLAVEKASLISQATPHEALLTSLTVFVLAIFVGYFVVWRVTPALHSPLMALTNAISSVIIVGAVLACGLPGFGMAKVAGFIAVTLAAVNIFGGFLVTRRMLSMFLKKK